MKNLIACVPVAAVLFWISAGASACEETESRRPLTMVAQATGKMLLSKNFAGLDAMVAQYRRPDSLTSDGQPNLAGLYAGFAPKSEKCGAALDKAAFRQRRALLEEWRTKSADPSAAGIALAELDADEGIEARGEGYARTVSEQGWRGLKLGMDKSRSRLQQLAAAAKIDPQWYYAMLQVEGYQGHGSKDYEALFSRAVAAYPYYLPYYFSKAMFTAEKWHGRPGEFAAFVDQTVKATSPKLGQTMYARLHWISERDEMFAEGKTDWPRMKAGFEAMLKAHPDHWNRNNYAKFACRAEDWVTADAQIKLIGPNVIQAAWKDAYDDCKFFADKLAEPNR